MEPVEIAPDTKRAAILVVKMSEAVSKEMGTPPNEQQELIDAATILCACTVLIEHVQASVKRRCGQEIGMGVRRFLQS